MVMDGEAEAREAKAQAREESTWESTSWRLPLFTTKPIFVVDAELRRLFLPRSSVDGRRAAQYRPDKSTCCPMRQQSMLNAAVVDAALVAWLLHMSPREASSSGLRSCVEI
jgi:hypothetical protein